MKVQRKLYNANTALGFFTTRTWKFANDKLLQLDAEIPVADKKAFRYALVEREPLDFFKRAMVGARRYLMKQPDETLEADIRFQNR